MVIAVAVVTTDQLFWLFDFPSSFSFQRFQLEEGVVSAKWSQLFSAIWTCSNLWPYFGVSKKTLTTSNFWMINLNCLESHKLAARFYNTSISIRNRCFCCCLSQFSGHFFVCQRHCTSLYNFATFYLQNFYFSSLDTLDTFDIAQWHTSNCFPPWVSLSPRCVWSRFNRPCKHFLTI